MVRPASPFIYGAFATIMDMKTSVFSYGAPEMNVMASAMAQMAQFYNIPFMGMSGCSDAKRPDQQAAVEATFSCLCSSMSGANMVHDNGWLDRATLVSPEYMVLVNEIIEMVNHYMAGMRVDDDRLALDILDKVGPGGNFLNEPHTFKYFREVWYSKLFDRSTAANWRETGGQGVPPAAQRADPGPDGPHPRAAAGRGGQGSRPDGGRMAISRRRRPAVHPTPSLFERGLL